MRNELKPCPFVSDDWCITFEEPCIAVRGDICKERERIKSHYGSLEKRNEELEAENKRLREALEIILKTTEQDPEFVCFIKATAEDALKGAGE